MNVIIRHSRNGKVLTQWSIDQLFDRINKELIVVTSQREEDYLNGMCLMQGKQLRISQKVEDIKQDHLHINIPDL